METDHHNIFSSLNNWKEDQPEKKSGFTAMITPRIHLQPQYKYELFHIYFIMRLKVQPTANY